MEIGTVVLLVDHIDRDLLVSTLIAHQLEKLGIRCHLEPLESYQGCLECYRPDMIIFNHLVGSHLAAFSKRLKELGVLVGVLPNEGLIYDRDARLMNAGKFHADVHIDHFFCWQQAHKEALIETGLDKKGTQIHVIGIPRFDLYFSPWSKFFDITSFEHFQDQNKSRVLFCTNYGLAHYKELPPDQSKDFFAPWKDRVEKLKSYEELVEVHYDNRERSLDFMTEIAQSGKFNLVIKIHPRETTLFYQTWLDGLDDAWKKRVVLTKNELIYPLIMACDVEISTGICTTSLESWIAGKPTIDIVLKRHPWTDNDALERLNPILGDGGKAVELIDQVIASPEQSVYAEGRKKHLATWCHTPQGDTAKKMASVIAAVFSTPQQKEWSRLSLNDYKRGWKLRLLRRLGLPYNFSPLVRLKARLLPERYSRKKMAYEKTIRPHHVRTMRDKFAACFIDE
uniref:Uncharacterized protein n=1 Tax=Magnetococcus massalia (strain MO-1) TaxID=451514 RepID=A0A1S7LK33_MAGMO|nr:Conserved protein of unknown function [Candidatus Magnetococcus massalia]